MFALYLTVLAVIVNLIGTNAQGPYKQHTSLTNVPYAQKYTINCSAAATEWHYIDLNTKNSHKITANDTFQFGESSLTITETRKDQLNVDYVCTTNGEYERFSLQPVPFMYALEKSSVTVTEGGTATATCKLIVGFSRNETVTWKWLLDDAEFNVSDSRITVDISDDKSESKLTIKVVTQSDRGDFKCVADNGYGSYNHSISFRVKSTLAALWPFLGIIGEVIILCLIILIFEKKCGKKSSQESNSKEEQNDNLLKQKESDNSNVKKRTANA